eukprot:4427963-Alexandrium_andersonii.AAC.1
MLGLPCVPGYTFWEQLGVPETNVFHDRLHVASSHDALAFLAEYALKLGTWIRRFFWLEPPPLRSPQFE